MTNEETINYFERSSEAVVYGMKKSIVILDKYKAESEE